MGLFKKKEKNEHIPDDVEKLWECNNCGYHFGPPWFNPDMEVKRCTYCGSSNIKILKKKS